MSGTPDKPADSNAAANPSEQTGSACAICGKPALVRYRPFCSKRCADIDLSRWMNGAYVIEDGPAIDEENEG